jgi:hypothetical protein
LNYLKTFKNVSITALSCASVVLVAKNMEQGKATVEFVRPIDISARESLNFGRVILMDSDQGGRVTVNADGTFEHDRTGLVFDLSKGNPRAGTFNLTGDGDTGFNVHLPRTVIQLRQVVVSGTAATLNATIHQLRVGTTTLPVAPGTAFTTGGAAAAAGAAARPAAFKLSGSPTVLSVGAQLMITGKSATGTYAGEYDVTIVHD